MGVPLINGGTVRLPRLVGHSRAMDLVLTGRAVGAEEALTMGLANRVVPDGQTRTAAEELAYELAALPQGSLRADRLSAIRQLGLSEAEAMGAEFGSLSQVAAESVPVRGASPTARAAIARLPRRSSPQQTETAPSRRRGPIRLLTGCG